MSYNNPVFFLYTIPLLLIIFYILQGIKDNKEVSSLLFWQHINRKSHSFKIDIKFIPDILFFSQLLILLLLITAILQPYFFTERRGIRRVILIIDSSASMQADDIKPNRFKEATKNIREMLGDLGEDTEVALIKGSNHPEIVQGFTRNKSLFNQRLTSLTPTESPLKLKETLQMAKSLLSSQQEAKIYFFTDGVSLSENELLKDIEIYKVGTPLNNQGIVDFDIKNISGRAGEYELFLQLANYSSKENNLKLEVHTGDRISFRDELIVAPGREKTTFYTLNLRKPTFVDVKLADRDKFMIDNSLFFRLGDEINENLNVVCLGDDNFFLERALMNLNNVSVFSHQDLDGVDMSAYDIYIFNNLEPPEDFKENSIFINTAPSGKKLKKINKEGVAEVIKWNKNHSIMRFVDFRSLKISKQIVLKDESNETLVHSTYGPLISVGIESEYRWIFMGFELKESNFPLLTSYPIFIANIVEWFYPGILQPGHNQIKTGSSVAFTPRKEIKDIISPQGNNLSYNQVGGKVILDNLSRKGNYRIKYRDDTEEIFSANLASRRESNLLETHDAISRDVNDKENNQKINLWPYFILLTLIALIFEWYIFCKKKRGI